MNLDELRAAVRDRCDLRQSDPRATDATLNRLINDAIRYIGRRAPDTWSWLRAQTTVTLAADWMQGTMADFVGDPTVVAIGKVTPIVQGYRMGPLDRVPEENAWDMYANVAQAQTPEVWAVKDGIVTLRPAAPAGTQLVISYTREEVELADDGDTPILPARHHDLIVERAAGVLFRQLHNLSEAKEAIGWVDDECIRIRRQDRQYMGPGKVTMDRDRLQDAP